MAEIIVIMLLAMMGATLLMSCSAFILVDTCPAPSPCTCSGNSRYSYVNCQSKNLKVIPDIKRSNNHVDTLYLNFYSNNLTIIPDMAFINFSSINAAKIYLALNSNKIHTIDKNAFSGIEHVTNRLRLGSNNLTSVPIAIGKLVNLQTLDIYGNPLHSIDSSVMAKIGRSLTRLSLTMGLFTEWPQEFHYLHAMNYLQVQDIPFSHLDINAFHGFETTLTILQLDHPKLEKVPYAICQLSHLEHLHFRYDIHLKENKSSIFEPCTGNMSTVKDLDLTGNGLRLFPDVFTLFPSLVVLHLDSNKLQFIEFSKISTSATLTHIYLDRNVFNGIPYALNNLKSLTYLSIRYNNIKTVETPDVAGLHMLTYLDLYGNPIMYISPSAFQNNLNIYQLELSKTNLDHVPLAVTILPKLRNFGLSGRPIDCTCDMSYLKHWNASAVTNFVTLCAFSTETIKTYVMNYLQSCP